MMEIQWKHVQWSRCLTIFNIDDNDVKYNEYCSRCLTVVRAFSWYASSSWQLQSLITSSGEHDEKHDEELDDDYDDEHDDGRADDDEWDKPPGT